MLEGGVWSDKFKLSLDDLVNDDLWEDFELFFELDDELEPFWLSAWVADLHFLVNDWCNSSLITHWCNVMWSWTTGLAWFYFNIYVWFFRISQLDEFKLKSGAKI